jgi:hypothetical protein
MRKPRPEDYDPAFKHKGPRPEEIDMAGVVALKPKPAAPEPVEETGVRDVGDVRNVRDVRGVRPKKRQRKRHPFDIFNDQLDSLINLKHKAMLRGEETSMSAMVREALDEYIKQHE